MPTNLNAAIDTIKAGEVIAFPTETVYGLMGDARITQVRETIYALKRRPANMPFQVMFRDIAHAKQHTIFMDAAHQLAEAFLPGAMTLITPRKPSSAIPQVTLDGEKDTIGIRIPDHAPLQALLAAVDMPLVATSANLTGEPPATRYKEAIDYFGSEIVIVEQEEMPQGTPSTVVDATTDPVTIIREGAITESAIREVLA